jgi:hypothetical protein
LAIELILERAPKTFMDEFIRGLMHMAGNFGEGE